MEKWIVKLSDNAFAYIANNTLYIKYNFEEASMFDTIGDAWKAAIFVNKLLNTNAKAVPHYVH